MRETVRALTLVVLAVLATSCRVTDASLSTGTIGVGPAGLPWEDGRAASRAILRIPDGALVGVDSAKVILVVSWVGDEENSSDVEIEVSGFANAVVRAPSGDEVFELRARVPKGCDSGCEVETLLVASHGVGEPPSFAWKLDFILIYDAESIPVPESEFDVEFAPVPPPGP